MILAVITPTDIFGILVPLTGLLVFSFAIVFLFLKYESKNYQGSPTTWVHQASPYVEKVDNSDDSLQNSQKSLIWVHKAFPYVEKLDNLDDSLQYCEGPRPKKEKSLKDKLLVVDNMPILISKLNNARKNVNLDHLKQEIHNLKELFNRYQSIKPEQTKFLDDIPSIVYAILPNFFYPTLEDFPKWIKYLENLLSKLQSPSEITIAEIEKFLNAKIDNCNGWMLETKDLKLNEKNKSSDEDKKYFNSVLDNFGKAGIIELAFYDEDFCYLEEDENVFEAVKEIMSIVAPKQAKNYRYKKKYRNDPRLETLRILYEEQGEEVGMSFELTIDCSPELKDKQVWKEKIKEIKEEDNQFEYDF